MKTNKQNQTWRIHQYSREDSPGRQSIESLCNGEQAVVVFKDALPTTMLAACQNAIERYRSSANTTTYTNGSLTTIGPYLAKHIECPDDYFASAQIVEDRLFNDSNLPSVIRDFLSRKFEARINVASESDGRKYAGAIVRLHGNGVSNPLHNDNIMRDAKDSGLVVAGLKHQLSCIVCLQECTEGGVLQHYQRVWNQNDERFKIPNGLGYQKEVVADQSLVKFKPATGDVYVMNPTYYHSINTVIGAERRTLGFFLGCVDDQLDDWITWS